MNRRKEERYRRAMARLKPQAVEDTTAKVDAAIAASPNKNRLPADFRGNYINHKLGIRRVRNG